MQCVQLISQTEKPTIAVAKVFALQGDISAEELEKMLSISEKYAQKMHMKPYYMYRQKNMVGNFENVGYCVKGKECI